MCISKLQKGIDKRFNKMFDMKGVSDSELWAYMEMFAFPTVGSVFVSIHKNKKTI